MSTPARPDRPEGYRATGRVERASGRRSGIGAIAAAASLGVLVALGALGRGPDAPVPSPGPSSGPSAVVPAPTPLPVIAVYRADAPTLPQPVFQGGLRWLDPATGIVGGDPYAAPRGTFFVGPDRVLCVCDDAPWVPDGTEERLTLVWTATDGSVERRRTFPELTLRSDRADVDAIRRDVDLEGDRLAVGWMVHALGGWTVGLDDVPLGDGEAARTVLGLVPADSAADAILPPIVRIAADGAVRVTVRARHRPGLGSSADGWTEWAWIVRDGVVDAREPATTTTPESCDGEGYAGTAYVRVCYEGDSVITPIVEVERDAHAAARIPLAPLAEPGDIGWIIDRAAGALYRWSPLAHVLDRIDVATGDVGERLLDGAGTGLRATPDPARPLPATDGTRHATLVIGAGDAVRPVRFALSADGRRVYALGQTRVDVAGSPTTISTGIWVFDTADLALVRHWGPDQPDSQLAVSPDGAYLVTISRPGITTNGRPGPWGMAVAWYATADGAMVERVGNILGADGFTPVLLGPVR